MDPCPDHQWMSQSVSRSSADCSTLPLAIIRSIAFSPSSASLLRVYASDCAMISPLSALTWKYHWPPLPWNTSIFFIDLLSSYFILSLIYLTAPRASLTVKAHLDWICGSWMYARPVRPAMLHGYAPIDEILEAKPPQLDAPIKIGSQRTVIERLE